MDDAAKGVVSECTIASDEDRITFPEVVGKLMAVGVERYHADFVRAEKTYYHPDGSFQVVPAHRVPGTPATAFSAQDVSAAVADSQAGTIRTVSSAAVSWPQAAWAPWSPSLVDASSTSAARARATLSFSPRYLSSGGPGRSQRGYSRPCTGYHPARSTMSSGRSAGWAGKPNALAPSRCCATAAGAWRPGLLPTSARIADRIYCTRRPTWLPG